MSSQLRSIVAGAASLDPLDPVVPAAAALARRLAAPLHVVHAYDPPVPVIDACDPAPDLMLDIRFLDRYGDQVRAGLETAVRGACAGAPVECHAVEGSACECLTEVARETGADLVIAGASRARLLRRLLGTTAEGVVRAGQAPVLVLRPPYAREIRRVLTAAEPSDAGAALQREALALIRALAGPAAEVRALRCIPADARAEDASLAARELAAFLRDRVGAPGVEPRVRAGEPADEILAEAAEWGADLVVVGAHPPRGRLRFRLGTVAGAVLRAAPCHVLVLASPAREPARAAAPRIVPAATPDAASA